MSKLFQPLKRIPTTPLQALGLSVALLLLTGWMLGWAAEFKRAEPGYRYDFPADHAAHPDFKTEWWYYTGHLQAKDEARYGYELTFFRVGIAPEERESPAKVSEWQSDTVYAAHFAVTDEAGQTFHFTEKLNRPGIGVAGAREDAFLVWNELWFAEGLGQTQILHAASEDFDLRLSLTPEKPPVIHGESGISQKASCQGCASHYYSFTRLKTDGLMLRKKDGGLAQALPVTGTSWMDHEFGSNQLTDAQTGWDWFSVQLDDNTELMLYLLRQADGQPDPNSSGTLIAADGSSRHLRLSDFSIEATDEWTSPQTHATYPMGWHIRLPGEKIDLTLTPSQPDQELATQQSTGVTYWEGSTHVRGQAHGKGVTGQAYVEMTGYAQAFRQKI